MDLLRFTTVLKHHRLIMTFGIVLGLAAVFGLMYRYDARAPGGARLVPRSYTTYTSAMQLLVVDPRFGLGFASTNVNDQTPDTFDKTLALAQTYADLLMSDVVRGAADKSVGPLQGDVLSQNVQGSPIITVTMTGKDPEALTRYGRALADSFQRYLKREQDLHTIPTANRMSVRLLTTGRPSPEQSRTWEIALLGFLVPVAGAYGFALIRERWTAPGVGSRAAQDGATLTPVEDGPQTGEETG